MKKLLHYGIAFFALPLLLLLLLEGLVRAFAPDDLSLRISATGSKNYDYPDGFYTNQPDFEGMLWNRPVRINAYGLRGPALQSKTQKRILLLGDSILFGLGLSDEDTAAYLLPALLGDSVEVLNSSVIGYSSVHQWAFLERFGDTLQPDMVVLGHCLNDLYPMSQPSTLGQLSRRPDPTTVPWFRSLSLAFNAWTRDHLLSYIWLKEVLKVYRIRYGYAQFPPQYEHYEQSEHHAALLKIHAWCLERNIPFGLLLFPHRDQLLSSNAQDDLPQQKLQAMAHDAQIPFVDMRTVLSFDDFLYADSFHLDRRGMYKTVQTIAQLYTETRRCTATARMPCR